jgi:hypothetical protein
MRIPATAEKDKANIFRITCLTFVESTTHFMKKSLHQQASIVLAGILLYTIKIVQPPDGCGFQLVYAFPRFRHKLTWYYSGAKEEANPIAEPP